MVSEDFAEGSSYLCVLRAPVLLKPALAMTCQIGKTKQKKKKERDEKRVIKINK